MFVSHAANFVRSLLLTHQYGLIPHRHDLKNIKLDDVFEHAGIAAQLSYGDMKMLRSVPQDVTHPFQKLSADEGPQGLPRQNADKHEYDSLMPGSGSALPTS